MEAEIFRKTFLILKIFKFYYPSALSLFQLAVDVQIDKKNVHLLK